MVAAPNPTPLHWQTYMDPYKPEFSGQIKKPLDALTPMPLNARKVISRRADRQGFQERGFLVHGEVAVFICICPADESDVDLFEGLVAKSAFPKGSPMSPMKKAFPV